MGDPAAVRRADAELWAALEALPGNVKGEILDGELYTQPRPRPGHKRASLALGHYLFGAFDDFDDGGPAGWVILVEPGIELPGAPEVAPDVAGWRSERLDWQPDDPIRAVPDWVCEVLSPSNAVYDRRVKFPFYARVGVPWLWVVDTRDRTVEVRKLESSPWTVVATFADAEPMRAAPFEALEIPLGRVWAPGAARG